ncbi:MAG: hypothetical protein DMG13_01210 [Acidobacteria bacterium]|nr:MAG: hypothetical protein DMG13_01210 [Acidobacteriota bacterium]
MFDIPLHKLIIHFPIALIIIAAVYDSWAAYSKRPEFHEAGYGLTLWAAVSALAAILTGLQLAGVTRIEPGVITGHAGFGIAAGIVVTALAVVRYSAHAREQHGYRIVWLVLEIGAAVLVIATAITGHRL